ncbi:phage protein [Buttiauxella brennerae ATCC 51605]|uniref:Phage protein n=1 Tax=Buttiauxella brennerae ATCC 51605 TaxID=1354251 RepID=A0A1B7INT4_9ENTR|nr:glucosyltransferase domain-containing protein [Buttiauxella brennerae]OAT31352.1 phage protein [Buttiauxella brennerae ATCC 51605]
MINNIKKYFFAVMFFTLPIIMANFYYIDDNGRSIEGYTNWGIDGRPLADFIMRSINLSSRLVDIFPLNIIVSALLLSLALSALKADLENNRNKNFLTFIIPLLMVFNIFYLEVFSYRFDSITISTAVMCCVFLSRIYKSPKIDAIITSALTVAAMSLYQTTINVAIILIIFNLILLAINENKPDIVFRGIAIKVISLISGVLIYYIIVLPASHSGGNGTDHPGVDFYYALVNIFINIDAMTSIVSNFILNNNGKYVLLFLFLLSQISCIILAVSSKKKSIVISMLMLISPLIVFISMFGVMLTLENILFSPRIYISYGAFSFFSFGVAFLAMPPKASKACYSCLLPITYSVVLSYAYGNTLKSQDLINMNTATKINGDIESIYRGNENVILSFNGIYPTSPVMSNTTSVFPQIKSMIPNYFANWWWSFQYMKRIGYTYTYPGPMSAEEAISKYNLCSTSNFVKKSDYSIFMRGNFALIDFSNSICNK